MFYNIKVNGIIILLICAVILISGCNNPLSNGELYGKEPVSENETDLDNPLKEETAKENNASFRYEDYIGKTWIEENNTRHVVSFTIYSIIDNQLRGELSFPEKSVPSSYDIKNLTGQVVGNVAKCEFSDSLGNIGTIELLFEDEKIKGDVRFSSKSRYDPMEGEFTFRVYKLTDLKELDMIEEQISTKYIDSIGEVTFVPFIVPDEIFESIIAMFLANSEGELIFRLFPDLPRGVDVARVEWFDINNDGLIDIIVVYKAEDYKGDMLEFVLIYTQDANSVFNGEIKLSVEINNSGISKDVDSIREYLKDDHYDWTR